MVFILILGFIAIVFLVITVIRYRKMSFSIFYDYVAEIERSMNLRIEINFASDNPSIEEMQQLKKTLENILNKHYGKPRITKEV